MATKASSFPPVWLTSADSQKGFTEKQQKLPEVSSPGTWHQEILLLPPEHSWQKAELLACNIMALLQEICKQTRCGVGVKTLFCLSVLIFIVVSIPSP